jgi:hypothetical protein
MRMIVHWPHAWPSIAAAFLASLVEFVEALTVVLAVGMMRGWDTVAVASAFKITMLEGLEVVFIVIAVGAGGSGLLIPLGGHTGRKRVAQGANMTATVAGHRCGQLHRPAENRAEQRRFPQGLSSGASCNRRRSGETRFDVYEMLRTAPVAIQLLFWGMRTRNSGLAHEEGTLARVPINSASPSGLSGTVAVSWTA